jgi:hypothetical protein
MAGQIEEITLAGSAAPTRFVGGPPATFTEQLNTDIDDSAPIAIHTTSIEQPTASQPAETLSTEEKEERRQLIRKIGRYRSLFPKELEDVSTSGLQSMPMEKLRDLSTDVEFLVGTRRSAKAVRGMFIAGLQAGELAGPLVGLQLEGLANVAASSEELLLTVDECAVRYEKVLYVDPVARLALAIAQLALAVDSHNRRQKTGVTPSVTIPAVVVPTAGNVAAVPTATPQAAYDGPPPRGVAPTTPMNLEGSTLAPEKAAGAAATRLDNIATAADYQDL